jgi:LmbE family N-acetylglucosaminyl deacetylase
VAAGRCAGIPSADGVEFWTVGTADMMALTPVNLRSVAVIAAGCDDIAIGAGATLIEIARDKPDLVVHALVLTGGGTEREVEEKNAFAALCPSTDVRLTVADLPSARLPDHSGRIKKLLAEFRQDCEPDMVFGPHSGDHDQDRRLLAELVPTAFRDHPVLGYEILTWESDLPNPSLYLPIPVATAHEKARLLAQCYPSKAGRGWFGDEAFLGLMRVRGVQCRARYAEAFTVEKSVLDSGSDYSVN